jgi:death-on-curing protein
MKEPNWLELNEVLAIHAELLHRFGGLAGVRDAGALEGAMGRPLNRFLNEDPQPNLFALAASYAGGIVGNHPFLDGNKRVGFVAAALFLQANGLRLLAPEEEAVERTLALAARAIDENAYATWLGKNCEPWNPPTPE